ncbi:MULTISPECIES: hypothetical protein [unclassified Breznakia]|uniref:hypothetical protein n=1 Tax=unclassified Breznakia TaxID=2623764 RepID=UPI002475358A|nr:MULTISPECIES: hypothetical protein [unclassified Breznakia]MDH6367050.1 hypothetical protein [Breznakia sp. PH1-1]MDH6404178.1 hypothetical protein [Breznakia sp. PF1-11]MDH6411937.1 hypothetical protein [Breznakia sp. PFB1-11]MDH6414166.1 hypothetical protein [Breznakia sp. PFB1-14]MDH6418919.1 hypothetical protein [Breznakia sp. PFB1-12]
MIGLNQLIISRTLLKDMPSQGVLEAVIRHKSSITLNTKCSEKDYHARKKNVGEVLLL